MDPQDFKSLQILEEIDNTQQLFQGIGLSISSHHKVLQKKRGSPMNSSTILLVYTRMPLIR